MAGIVIFALFFGAVGSGASPAKKQERKEQSRWTLSEWLAQKERISLMDSWLSIHSSVNPYEYYVGGGLGSVKDFQSGLSTTGRDLDGFEAHLAVFAQIFGLVGEYESSENALEAYKASFRLRVLGNAQQGTNFTIGYGFWHRTEKGGGLPEEVFRNHFALGSFTLYIAQHFGLEWEYRWILNRRGGLDTALTGHIYQAMVFLDFSIFRIFGLWRRENLEFSFPAGGVLVRGRQNLLGGLQVFF